jgi:hypothetical protein
MTVKSRQLEIACAAVVTAYFLYSAGGGVLAYLSTDDLMNLHGYWLKPWWRNVLDNVLYFSPSYRPMGAMFYLPSFYIFGLESLPYRVLCFALMLANLWLLWRLVVNLSAPPAVAFGAVLIACYHPALAHIYHDGGTAYDMLCFFFCFSILSKERPSLDRPPRPTLDLARRRHRSLCFGQTV